MRKPKSIVIIGRRWFHRGPGNTYHSCIALVDGKQAVSVDFCYGYGNQWEWTARTEMDKAGFLPGIMNRNGTPGESLWQYCDRLKIAYSATVTDVACKRELAFN